MHTTIDSSHPGAITSKHRTLFLVAIALGVLLNPLNSSMISVALARLEHVYRLNFTDASWLISTYYLASAIAQPVMGKLADTLGRKRVFLTGLILVAVSSATAPFAPSFGWLMLLRLIQSFGSGAIFPAGMGIVRRHITDHQAQALAFMAVFSSGAAAFGPSIGGLLMHWWDWQSIFWVNFPFIIASIALGLWILPSDRKTTDRGATSEPRAGENTRDVVRSLDIPGIVLFAIAIVTMLLFLLSLTTGVKWWSGVVGAGAIVGFLLRETRTRTPFIDAKMFGRNKALSWVLIQFVTVNIIFYSIFFGMPTYLQEVRHFNARDTGLLMLFVAGFGVIMAPITGRWVEKSGSRPPLLLAGVFMTVGSALYLTVQDLSPIWWLSVVLAVLGLSNGFNNVGLQTALFRVTPSEIISAASGLFQTSRYIGTILSTLLLGILFSHHLSTADLHQMGVVLALLGLLVLWMSWRLPKKA